MTPKHLSLDPTTRRIAELQTTIRVLSAQNRQYHRDCATIRPYARYVDIDTLIDRELMVRRFEIQLVKLEIAQYGKIGA